MCSVLSTDLLTLTKMNPTVTNILLMHMRAYSVTEYIMRCDQINFSFKSKHLKWLLDNVFVGILISEHDEFGKHLHFSVRSCLFKVCFLQ